MENPIKRRVRRGKSVLIIDFRYNDEKGRRRRFRHDASVQTMAGARAEANRLMQRAAATGSPVQGSAVPTFGTFIETHYRPVCLPGLRPGTAARYEGILRQGVFERFRHVPLDEINMALLVGYAAALEKQKRTRPLRGRTHGIDPRGPINMIKSVVRAAVDVGVLPRMPDLPSFREGVKLPGAPLVEHVDALLAVADGWLRAAIALQAYAGLRQGEVRALQVGDVDLAENVIRVRRAYSVEELVTPKGDRQRVVPIADGLADMLRPSLSGKLPLALVVTGPGGLPVPRQRYLARLKALQRKHGLEGDWSSHALRHHFCSMLVRNGANIEAVRALAGHSNVRTTQRYLHATGGDLRSTIAKLRGN